MYKCRCSEDRQLGILTEGEIQMAQSQDKFIGRQKELKTLNRLLGMRSASLVVINGRRRIGKSRLIDEFAKTMKHYTFSALPPREGMTAQVQRDEFARQFQEQFGFPGLKADNWGDLFTLLAKQTQQGRLVILFDEISWMATGDPDFLGKLKVAWDVHFKKNSQLIFILCGSVSSWIEKNIIRSTGYLGRPTLHMTLNGLPLPDCNQFWGTNSTNISSFEKFKYLSVTGGVPRYLELLNPQLTAEKNIQFLCFSKDGPLFDEFRHIFDDVYKSRSPIYLGIIEYLAKGKATQEQISQHVNIAYGGDLSDYLNDLVIGGFVARDHTWTLKTGNVSRLSYYRLKDNYTRFYLKYILPNKERIEKGQFEERSLSTLPGWSTILGLQFENLVLNNRKEIIRQLGIAPEDVVFDNAFFQRKTTRQSGCQIDYLIQTRHDCVYVREIKFSRFAITPDVINEVKEKTERLKLPKHFSSRSVLIHVNGVREDVADSTFFSDIIDFGTLLT